MEKTAHKVQRQAARESSQPQIVTGFSDSLRSQLANSDKPTIDNRFTTYQRSGEPRGSQNSHEEDGPQASAVLPHLRHRLRAPRDGRVMEELGTYDPMVADTDARAVINGDRIEYWLGVGAQPSEKVKVLIKKYGSGRNATGGTAGGLERLALPKAFPTRARRVCAAAEEGSGSQRSARGRRPSSPPARSGWPNRSRPMRATET